MQYHARSLRKPTGGKRVRHHKKKKYEMGRIASLTKVGTKRKSVIKTKGGGEKHRLWEIGTANVYDPKTKKSKQVKIIDVVDNKAHHQFAKLKVITKGAIIKTEAGDAKVTSRPGQIGSVDAVLV